MEVDLAIDLYDVHLTLPKHTHRSIGVGSLSYLRKVLKYCVEKICLGHHDPLYNLCCGPKGLLNEKNFADTVVEKSWDIFSVESDSSSRARKEQELDDLFCQLAPRTRQGHLTQFKFGKGIEETWRVLFHLDRNFMTTVTSSMRFGQLHSVRRNLRRAKRMEFRKKKLGGNASLSPQTGHAKNAVELANELGYQSAKTGENLIQIYYEEPSSILPLPPFLASFPASRTRTISDILFDLLWSEEDKSYEDATLFTEGLAAHRLGYRSLREILRTIDTLPNSLHEATHKLMSIIETELKKSPESRTWNVSERYRRAYLQLSKMMQREKASGNMIKSVAAKPGNRKSSTMVPGQSVVQPNLQELMAIYFVNLQRRSRAYAKQQMLYKRLCQQLQYTKEFNRAVHDEIEYLRMYLRKVYEGFKISLMHGGKSFAVQALIKAGASPAAANQLIKQKTAWRRSKRSQKKFGTLLETASNDNEMHKNPLLLIQKISELHEQGRLELKKPDSQKDQSITEISSTRVALAREGHLKATFKEYSYQELRQLGIICQYEHDAMSIEAFYAADASGSSEGKCAGLKYFFSGEKNGNGVFTVTVSRDGNFMVESFVISIEHLSHLYRTMALTYCPPGSQTWFYVETLLQMLQSMQKHQRVLSFGS